MDEDYVFEVNEREGKIVGLQFFPEFLLSSGLGDIFRNR